MGTISVNKLAALSLIVGPVLALVCWFITPGGPIIDAADPADAQATIVALASNATFSQITGVLIPIGLVILLYGIANLTNSIRSNGNGGALAGYGDLLLRFGLIGFVITSGLQSVIAGTNLEAAAEVSAAGTIHAATLGINTVSSILAALGFLSLSLAISTRDDYNKTVALVVAVASAVALVGSLIGGMDTDQLQNMQLIIGITWLITAAWSVMIGLNMLNNE